MATFVLTWPKLIFNQHMIYQAIFDRRILIKHIKISMFNEKKPETKLTLKFIFLVRLVSTFTCEFYVTFMLNFSDWSLSSSVI